jgi:predicted esterase
VSDRDPHLGQPVYTAGQPLEEAQAAMVLIHGRGATAPDILRLAGDLHHDGFAYIAPQAAGNTWYPQRFLAPLEQNEPFLSSALAAIERALVQVETAGISTDRVIIGGFSQGACLAAEFVARHTGCCGGLFVLSGGLIGPPGTVWQYNGRLDRLPVFLGCGTADPHVPLDRVYETARVFRDMGAEVTQRIYPDMGHMINQDEIDHVRDMMRAVSAGDPTGTSVVTEQQEP